MPGYRLDGASLKRARLTRRLTAAELATTIGRSTWFIWSLEAGKRRAGLDTLRKLETALGVSAADLGVTDIPDREDPNG